VVLLRKRFPQKTNLQPVAELDVGRTMIQRRNYRNEDAAAINSLAVRCFTQYKDKYSDWASFENGLNQFSDLARLSEIIIAELDGKIVGAVAYVPPDVKKAEHFPQDTPIIRMLVVDPKYRGLGLGSTLSEECFKKAERDKCKAIALHTSSIMEVALPMYLRMGFELYGPAPDIYGVTYNVFIKKIA
jgi:ribosomal protein S18 acetylase RimI-like enzyme